MLIMHLETDQMTQAQRLECIMNHQKPDRIPILMMEMPEYGEFYQDYMKKKAAKLGYQLVPRVDGALVPV